MSINANVTNQQITAAVTVSGSSVTVSGAPFAGVAVSGGVGPQGPKGDTGLQGPVGATGPKGDAGTVSGAAYTAESNTFSGANAFYNAAGQTFGTAQPSQDGIVVAGRDGGSGSLRATLTTEALSAPVTNKLPATAGTLLNENTLVDGGAF